ncbi:hypothetical protein OAQ99_04740 [Candidatus Kapabacteria bacterium]|nr:hypothetical protein [Candidatus Kapabacteria bacterium]
MKYLLLNPEHEFRSRCPYWDKSDHRVNIQMKYVVSYEKYYCIEVPKSVESFLSINNLIDEMREYLNDKFKQSLVDYHFRPILEVIYSTERGTHYVLNIQHLSHSDHLDTLIIKNLSDYRYRIDKSPEKSKSNILRCYLHLN